MSNFIESNNPLLIEWNTPYKLPPFSLIKSFHYKPAILDYAFPNYLNELKDIVNSNELPSFENTIVAFDRAGSLLNRIYLTYSNQCSSLCPPDLQAVQLELSGPLAELDTKVKTFPGLFQRIVTVYNERHNLNLNSEQIRLVERIHLDFIRAGAHFDEVSQARYTEIVMELAVLETQFSQNVLFDESNFFLELPLNALEGLPSELVEAAKQAAIDRNLPDSYGITISRSIVEPFLTFCSNREYREKAWKAWINRGQLDSSHNNSEIIQKILVLRNEQARLHGYDNYAAYSTADTMAKTSTAVMSLLEKVWEPAKIACNREKQQIEEFIRNNNNNNNTSEEKESINLEPWDWRYYAEKIRVEKYSFDSSQLKPYFSLTQMCNALFDCAYQLFKLKFVLMENNDYICYHPDVKVYQVYEHDPITDTDTLRAIFLHDNYSRLYKQSGAWMSEYRKQTKNFNQTNTSNEIINNNMNSIIPVIVNNNNFNKAPEGSETLLSYDDIRTLFHEFGHGLHGMLSNVTYETLAGTSVLKDFLELPSQIFEHWVVHPTVLSKFAKHYQTGEIIPTEYLQKLENARNFNNGFNTVEYLSCALYDQYLHQLPISSLISNTENNAENNKWDINEIESNYLNSIEMPQNMILRHRSTHFLHLFSGSSYAAGYYVYLWAEVLDADGFDAFLEKNDVFDPETAHKLQKYIYSAGNSIDPNDAYRLFRGRDPTIIPMLKKKGLYSE